MPLSPLLLIHICGATVGLLSGFMAMTFRKGSGLHGAAGNVFFVSMLAMSSTGAYIAAFVRPNPANVIPALLTFYLVSTAWRTARRAEGGTGPFDFGALLFILLVGVAAVAYGFRAANGPAGTKSMAAMYFIFAFAALLSVRSDIRLLRRGGVTGAARIGRHLLRMCFALLITTFSFYPGQAKLFPMWLRNTNLLVVPHIVLIGSMIFWSVRVLGRRRRQSGTATHTVPILSGVRGV